MIKFEKIQFNKSMRGISLLEIMMALTIATVSVSSITILVQRLILANAAYIDNRAQARYIMDVMQRDMQGAIAVESSRTYDSVLYEATNNDLILKIPSIDATGAITDINNDFDYIIYRAQGNNLIRVVDAKIGISVRTDQIKTLCANLGSVIYTYSGTHPVLVSDYSTIADLNVILQISRTFSAGVAPSQKTETIASQVKFRNKII